MNRSILQSIGIAVTGVLVSLFSSPLGAAAQPAPSAGLTVDQVRSSFSSAGFQVDQAHTWDWTSPPVTTLQVQDGSDDRVLLVLVYASPTAAQAARLQAEDREQLHNPGSFTADGPRLVEGYGPSVWNNNVALVETTRSELAGLYQRQLDIANGVDVQPDRVVQQSVPNAAVGLDFQQALTSSVVNL
jgi:hypothetical protein